MTCLTPFSCGLFFKRNMRPQILPHWISFTYLFVGMYKSTSRFEENIKSVASKSIQMKNLI